MHSDATPAQLENGEREHGGHEWGSRQQRPTCTRPNATYACRHSYATHPYRASGNDLEVVQEQLGHASIKTTTIYAKVTKEDKARAADALARAYRSSQQNRETGTSRARRSQMSAGIR